MLAPHSTTSLASPFGGGHAAPDSDFLVLDCVFETVDPYWAGSTIGFGFDDESADAFLEEDIA
jgi:hypothetical protein